MTPSAHLGREVPPRVMKTCSGFERQSSLECLVHASGQGGGARKVIWTGAATANLYSDPASGDAARHRLNSSGLGFEPERETPIKLWQQGLDRQIGGFDLLNRERRSRDRRHRFLGWLIENHADRNGIPSQQPLQIMES